MNVLNKKMIKEIPMLFSDMMVPPIMSGQKTETRRDRNLTQINENPDEWEFVRLWDGHAKFCEKHNWTNEKYIKCPYGAVGDVIWVRETWRTTTIKSETPGSILTEFSKAISFKTPEYNAINIIETDNDWYDSLKKKNGFRPNMHLPRRYARTFLEITDITIERLKEITPESCIAEGIDKWRNPLFQEERYRDYSIPKSGWKGVNERRDPVYSYMTLWEMINGKGSWEVNPWIWVIKFQKLDNYGS